MCACKKHQGYCKEHNVTWHGPNCCYSGDAKWYIDHFHNVLVKPYEKQVDEFFKKHGPIYDYNGNVVLTNRKKKK
jgi:tRNA(Ile)-lysidine synthase TilS/MesJ